MRPSDRDSSYSRPLDTDHHASQAASAMIGLTTRSRPRGSESNNSRSSFLQIQSNRQRLPAQSLDDAQEWNVWEGQEVAPLNSQERVQTRDFLEQFFKLTSALPMELKFFEAESLSVTSRRQFLYTHQRAKNIYFVRPGGSLDVLDSHNFKHWKVTPLFEKEGRGYFRRLKLGDPVTHNSPGVFCVKQSLDNEEEDELIYFEGLFRDPQPNFKYQKTLLLRQKGIRDYELTRNHRKNKQSFVLLISTDTHYVQIEYYPNKGKVVKLGVAPRGTQDKEQLVSVAEAVWLGSNESLHCWNLETNELRQTTLNIRKQKMSLKQTPNYLVLVKTKLYSGPLIMIVFSRELEVLQRIQIEKLVSSEVQCVRESGDFLLVLLDSEVIRIDTTTWKWKKQFISLSQDSFKNCILITTCHLNVLIGLSQKQELVYSWNPSKDFVVQNLEFSSSRVHAIAKGFNFFSLLELARSTEQENFLVNQALAEMDRTSLPVATMNSAPLHWKRTGIEYEKHLFIEREMGEPQQVELFSDQNPEDIFELVVVWERGRTLYLWCGRQQETVKLESMLTSLGSNENVRMFLSRILFILPFKPQLKGDLNSLLEVRPLPNGYYFVLRGANLTEVYTCRNSRLLKFKDKDAEMVLVSLWKFQKRVEVEQLDWPLQEGQSLQGSPYLLETDQNLYVCLQKEQKQLDLLSLAQHKIQKIVFKEEFVKLREKGPNFIVEAEWGYSALHFIPLRFPLEYELELELGKATYFIEKGSTGMAVFIDFIEFEGTPSQPVTAMEDYVNNFLYFHSRGFSLKHLDLEILHPQQTVSYRQDSPEPSPRPLQRYSMKSINDSSSAQQDQRSPRWNVEGVLERVAQAAKEFYLSVGKCKTDELILTLLHHFESFEEMNEALGKGRFMASLVTHICQSKAAQFLFLFEDQQLELLRQANKGLLSLKLFYELAALKLREVKIAALKEQNQLETRNRSVDDFVARIPRNREELMYGLEIYRSAFKLPPSRHPATLEMATLLYDTRDLEVFQTSLLRIFIQERWNEARGYFLVNACLLLISLGILFVHSSWMREYHEALGLLTVLVIIQVWMLFVEIVEMLHKRASYFREFWNWFDLSRIVLTFIYFGIGLGQYSDEVKSDTLTLLNLFQALRTFHVFFLFKGTRVLLRIVIEIISDMSAFFVFVAMSTLLLALLFTSATPENQLEQLTYTRRLMEVFLIDFGFFDPLAYTALFEFLFVVAVVTVNLVMMNMLISIMGDTYDRVKEDQSRRDLQELLGLVEKHEILTKFFTRCRAPRQSHFVFFSQEKPNESLEAIDHWEGRVKGIKKQIKKIQHRNEQWQESADQKFREREDWERKTEEWQRRLDRHQRKVDIWQRKTEDHISQIIDLLKDSGRRPDNRRPLQSVETRKNLPYRRQRD